MEYWMMEHHGDDQSSVLSLTFAGLSSGTHLNPSRDGSKCKSTCKGRWQRNACKSQASPQLRRKKISWTAEEEELIREGVQKFGSDDPKIPWKKILAFGAHVFEKNGKRRMPQDLKDKWKNMCKAQSKSNERLHRK
ncbi:hypothetical protein VNO77_15467 [Canavalia gladiata]|uniref:Myb-like domain-containing protein n=1 Tax=Canavalia gladiata TaxID=3824 RepID=A0AAN9M4C8_CANGL